MEGALSKVVGILQRILRKDKAWLEDGSRPSMLHVHPVWDSEINSAVGNKSLIPRSADLVTYLWVTESHGMPEQ